mmetsp:Transcript_15142/g.39340  ORF Transcript_15142/g.39340 Transcript_15142/m.39340 type:complete len:298 (-) Transcript_15142:208-1101(-)
MQSAVQCHSLVLVVADACRPTRVARVRETRAHSHSVSSCSHTVFRTCNQSHSPAHYQALQLQRARVAAPFRARVPSVPTDAATAAPGEVRQHSLHSEQDNRVPHDQVADRVEQVEPHERVALPREHLRDLHPLVAVRARVLLADKCPATDARLVVPVAAVEPDGRLRLVAGCAHAACKRVLEAVRGWVEQLELGLRDSLGTGPDQRATAHAADRRRQLAPLFLIARGRKAHPRRHRFGAQRGAVTRQHAEVEAVAEESGANGRAIPWEPEGVRQCEEFREHHAVPNGAERKAHTRDN